MKFRFVCILVLICIFINMSVVFASNDTNIDNNIENIVDNTVNTSNVKEVHGSSFKDIQDVIDLAEENDVIVLNGSYHSERVQIFVNKSITIEGKNNTVLNGSGLSRIFYINADNVVLKNLEITNGYENAKIGYIYIDNEHEGPGGGIYWRGNNGTLIDCDVWGNKIEHGQYGAIYWEGNNGRIINSYFNYNLAYGRNVTSCNVISGTIRGVINGTLYHYFKLLDNYSTVHSYDECDNCLIKDAWINSDFNLIISNVTVYSNVENVKIKFKLSYKDVPFFNENISVFAFGRNFTIVTDELGEAYLNVPNELVAGEYIIRSFYDNCSFNSTLNIVDLPCILSLDNADFYYNSNNEYFVKITSKNSQYFDNIAVSLKIGDIVLFGVSDNTGIVKFTIPQLNSGKYDIEANVYKNGKSDVFKSYINIKKINSNVKHSLKHKKLKISIVDKVSKLPLSNVKILAKITNTWKKYKKTLTTNKKGQISFKLKKGKNKIRIQSLNNNYNIKYKIKKIKV